MDVIISGIEPYSDDGGSNPLSWEVSRHIQWRTLHDAGIPSPFSLNAEVGDCFQGGTLYNCLGS
ncbi:hypothetical protein V6Z11_D13G178000 [Gossypium hirsutum]